MWSVGRRATDVYLGSNALAVCSQGDVEVAASCDGVSAALDMLGTWRDAQARRVSIRFWLSGALCRPFTIPVVRGVKTRDELQGIADATASARTGLVGACVSRVEEDKKGRAIGVAVQAETLGKIRDFAAGSSKALVLSIRPWWGEVLRSALRVRPTLPSLAVQDSDSLTVFAGQGTDLTMASTYAPVLGNETAAAALKRALMGVEPLLEETGLVRLVLAGTVSKPHGHSLAFDRLAEFTP